MKKIISILLCIVVVFALTCCDKSNLKINKAVQLNAKNGLLSNVSEISVIDEISAYKTFSGEFFQKSYDLTKEDVGKNLLVSPLSLYLCLSLLAAGSDGESRVELENAFGTSIEGVKNLSNVLYSRYAQKAYKNSKVNIANSIWLNKTYEDFVQSGFLSDATKYFNAQIYSADFVNDSVQDDVNSWVNHYTEGMIDKILDNVSSDTVAYLINALYLQSSWAEKYNYTIPRTFKNKNSTEKTVEFLSKSSSVYYSSEKAEAFIQPLSDGFCFMGILPKDENSASEYFSNMNWEEIETLFKSACYDYKVITGIPEFKYDYSIDLIDVFESFSLNSISNPYTANFTKLAQIPNGNFYVDNALQKTAIEVDKNGIKAAAVTKITGSNATSFNPNIPIEIWLDRPFAYLIFDRASVELGDVPIFYGVVENL